MDCSTLSIGKSSLADPALPELNLIKDRFLRLVFFENARWLARYIASSANGRSELERRDVALTQLSFVYLAAAKAVADLQHETALPGETREERSVWIQGVARRVIHQHFRNLYRSRKNGVLGNNERRSMNLAEAYGHLAYYGAWWITPEDTTLERHDPQEVILDGLKHEGEAVDRMAEVEEILSVWDDLEEP